MHAVIKTGGKQYRVAEGDVLQVETLAGEPGDSVAFDVLALGDGADLKVGTPLVDGAKVEAEVMDQTRGEKIIVFKKKRRQGYRRTQGHRQNLTVVRVTSITG
ncbi:50S ribosomal protein L21 [Minwuia sp.]|uniref:50S ribosomal protein L21 n=1 Tax=Minwuia sp. TaxID=2493630 RepID=UPI003A8F121E